MPSTARNARAVQWAHSRLSRIGLESALRYRALIRQGVLDIELDHERPGSQERPEIMIDGARTYHLSLEPDQS